jgi:hypothetical protein
MCLSYGMVCKEFTLKPELKEQRKAELINETTKKELYRHLFNSVKFLFNAKRDIWPFKLYYSLDQDKFLGIPNSDNRDLGNWIHIPLDKNLFLYLKEVLKTFNVEDLTMLGMKINGMPIRNDIWCKYEELIMKSFTIFYNENKVSIKNESNDKVYNGKPLF